MRVILNKLNAEISKRSIASVIYFGNKILRQALEGLYVNLKGI